MSASIGSNGDGGKVRVYDPEDISTDDYRLYRVGERVLLEAVPQFKDVCPIISEYTRHFATLSPVALPTPGRKPEIEFNATLFSFSTESVGCGNREVSLYYSLYKLDAFTTLENGVRLHVSSMYLRSHRYERPQNRTTIFYHRAFTGGECMGQIDALLRNPDVLRNESFVTRLNQMKEALVQSAGTALEALERGEAEKLIEETESRCVLKSPVIQDFLNDVRGWIVLPAVTQNADLMRRLRAVEGALDPEGRLGPHPNTDLSPDQMRDRAALKAEVEALPRPALG